MAQKGRFYRVRAVGKGLRLSYPLREVRGGTVVQALESAPKHSLDVVDVRLPSGGEKAVYSFQLNDVVRRPEGWGK